MRVFGGMTVEEVAAAQGTSPRTVKRNWAYARAWLGRELAAYDPRPLTGRPAGRVPDFLAPFPRR